ncbi:MAG: hypothetical protein H0U75_00465 [Legionella sp.]|nr:hypothetical protein [Legionella sp.]
MKKIILLLLLIAVTFNTKSQIATSALQTSQIVRLDSIAAREAAIRNVLTTGYNSTFYSNGYSLARHMDEIRLAQIITNARLDTTNARLEATRNAVSYGYNTPLYFNGYQTPRWLGEYLPVIKSSSDTTNQTIRITNTKLTTISTNVSALNIKVGNVLGNVSNSLVNKVILEAATAVLLDAAIDTWISDNLSVYIITVGYSSYTGSYSCLILYK